MFGFIHRLYIEYSDDENKPLIYFKLCIPYDMKEGIFKGVNPKCSIAS